MIGSLVIATLTCIALIMGILFFPKIKLGNLKLSSFWIIVLFGAILIVLNRFITIDKVIDGLTQNSSINPLKILSLFISMTILSIFLDEVGFFKHMASIVLEKAKSNQKTLFIYFYVLTSILTIFTSNDIIILTFTPFICYFSKNAKISPYPYLVSEFISANTWSMMLVIGNPTNIYIAQSFDISFIEYIKVMVIPTLLSGVSTFICLFLVFKKSLEKPIEVKDDSFVKEDKFLLIVGLVHLISCTILLAISSYINIEMYKITLIFAISLLIISTIYKLIKKQKNTEVINTLKRAPWNLIPFVISMFTIVLALKENQVTTYITELLGINNITIKYGLSSYLCCNLLNNIPMSLLFTDVIRNLSQINLNAIFSVIIGSNIGAFLSPIGALAGIMWMSILKDQKVKMSFFSFTKYGLIFSTVALLFALVGLSIIL